MAFTDHVKVLIGADTKGVEAGFNKAEKKAGKFASGMKAKLGAMLGVAVLARSAKSIIDFGASIGDLSDRVGVSAETLQTMQFAAEQNGSSAEEASKAVEKLSKSIGEAEVGSKLYADAFKRLGVELRDSEGNLKSTEKVMMEVADGMKDMEDPAIRVKTAFDLMGRGGTAMIQFMKNGSGAIEEYNKQLKENGNMLENSQVKQLQAASGELEKASRSFQIFGAKILPPVIKVLRRSQIGWELIAAAVKAFPGNLKILGKILKAEITDKMDLAAAKVDMLRLQFEKFTLKLNPFAEEAEIRKNADAMLAAEKKIRVMQAHSQKSFAQRKKELFEKDKEAAAHMQKNGETIKRLRKQLNDLDNEGSTTKEDILKKQGQIAEEAERELAAIQKLQQARTDQNKILERQLERVKALREGGEAALKAAEDRHKMEDQVQQLMEKGNMTRAEAVGFVKKINDAQFQEERLHKRIKEEQERKVKLKDQEADRKEIAEALQKEADLHKANREQMQQDLEIMRLRAAGNDKAADHLEKKISLEKQAVDLAEQLGITEKDAIGILQKKLDLEQGITDQKIQQEKQAIKNANLEIGQELDELGATDRNKALREMTPEEKKRAKEALRLKRLEDKLNDPNANLTDAEREKMEKMLERGKDKLLTDEQRKEIAKLDAKKKEAKEAADKLKKELDDKKAAIDKEIAKKEADRKVAEEAAKKKLQEMGDKIKDKMADAFTAGEKAIKNAGDAIVNALNRLRGIAPVVNVNAGGGGGGGSGGGSGSGSGDGGGNFDMGTIATELKTAVTAMGENIAKAMTNMPKPDIKVPAAPEAAEIKNDITIEMDGELNEETQQAILTALQGKFKNQ